MTDRAHGPGGPQASPSAPGGEPAVRDDAIRTGASDDRAQADAAQAKPPHLDESIRRVRAAGRQTVGSGVDAGRALRRLVSNGAQLKAFPKPVLQAFQEASLAAYEELSAKDPMFKKLYDSMVAFRDKQTPWQRLAEGGFDNLVVSLGQRSE